MKRTGRDITEMDDEEQRHTTVHRPRLQAAVSGDNNDSPTASGEGNSSLGGSGGGGSSELGGGGSNAAAHFRSSRSWTFASGNRRQHQLLLAASIDADCYSSSSSNANDRSSTWTPPLPPLGQQHQPPQSTSPHPLGYYSDSPPPPFYSVTSSGGVIAASTIGGRSSATGRTSPLLHAKMVVQDGGTSAAAEEHGGANLTPPVSSAHRSSFSGGSGVGLGGAGGGGCRRFSTSLHHPHCHVPLAQQLHHNHLMMAQQQSLLYAPTAASSIGGQRRRDSATAAAFAIMPTGPLWSDGGGSSGSNSMMSRLRRSRLGQSCPQLSSLVNSSSSAVSVNVGGSSGSGGGSGSGQFHYRGGAGPAVKLRRDIAIQRRHSHRMSRRSFHAHTSPVLNAAMASGGPAAVAAAAAAAACQCCSRSAPAVRQGSPVLQAADVSPGRPACSHHCHQQQQAAAAAGPSNRRNSLRVQYHDARRWSVASLPSSGYGTPGSSAMSSQYSSQERLAVAMGGDQQRCERYGSNDSNPGCCSCSGDQQRLNVHDTSPQLLRERSRSLSSIAWLNLSSSRLDTGSPKPGDENLEVTLRNNVYKERFPKAKRQMEEKLEAFLAENSQVSSSEMNSSYQLATLSSSFSESPTLGNSGNNLTVPGAASPRRASLTPPVVANDPQTLQVLSDGSARFIHHQIMELGVDCLQRSKSDSLSSAYFYELSQNLEELLDEAKDKAAPEAVEQLSSLVKKFLIILSRPARLLECLEFDPEEFYRMLHEAEGEAKATYNKGPDLPQYIIRQLGLNRSGPLQDLNACLTQSTDSGHGTDALSNQPSTSDHRPPSPSIAHRPPPPKESDFEVIKLVSNGAYGAVFLVRHRENRRRFALKKLNKTNLMLRNQIDQVYAERDILTFTDNPFVVSFYGSFETKRHLCMVMEYVEGGDCATLLKSIGVLPVEMARVYIAETVLAIEYLHSYGIVHRDLKPDNLLITAMGHIKLTDFGLSKIGLMNRTNLLCEGYFDALMTETTQFQDRQISGTPEYIAPEVILRQGYGKPVDWWAMGVILYEFLVGTVPFFGETPEELFSHVIADEIEWPEEPDAPPLDAQDLVMCLLQHNPLQRIGTVNGAIEIKEHHFFESLDWNSLLRRKAEFIPQLEGEDDTSYFDTRADRYQHELESGDDNGGGDGESETNSSTIGGYAGTSSPFASFSSSSPRYSFLQDDAKSSGGESSFDGLGRSNSFNNRNMVSNNSSMDISMSPGSMVLNLSTASDGSTTSMEQATPPTIVRIGTTERQSMAKPASLSPSKDRGVDDTVSNPSQEDVEVKWRRSGGGPAVALKRNSSSSSSDHSISIRPRAGNVAREMSPVRSKAASSAAAAAATAAARPHPSPRSTATAPKLAAPMVTPEKPSKPTPPPRQPTGQLTPLVSSPAKSPLVSDGKKRPNDALRVVIPTNDSTSASGSMATPISPTLSSDASSRDASPSCGRRRSCTVIGPIGRAAATGARGSQDLAPIVNQLKPPIVVRRGAKGFGFTLRAIRVYLGESDYYTIQHLIMAVESGSPACDAGLRPNDLLTHVNGESAQNLTHTDVIQRLMSGGDTITLRVSPLESTSIRQGGPRKSAGKLVKRKSGSSGNKSRSGSKRLTTTDKNGGKRRSSILLRRFGGGGSGSGRRESLDANMLTVGGTTNIDGPSTSDLHHHHHPHHRHSSATAQQLAQLAALQRSVSNTDGNMMNASLLKVTGERLGGGGGIRGARHSISVVASPRTSQSSRSNDSASSIDSNVAADAADLANNASTSSRPSSFRGLRTKVAQTLCPPSRRKQPSQPIPLSPLARSPQPPSDESTGDQHPLQQRPPSPSPMLLKPIVLAPVAPRKLVASARNSDGNTSLLSISGSSLTPRLSSPNRRPSSPGISTTTGSVQRGLSSPSGGGSGAKKDSPDDSQRKPVRIAK